MRTELLAIAPGILTAWLSIFRSLSTALFWVYLPVLLLIPDHLRLPIDGLPDPTFSQAAILPIGLGVCYSAISGRNWKWSWMDASVASFLMWQLSSDLYNVGISDAQNLGFDIIANSFFPYICGKALIESQGLRTRFVRRFVWLLFVVSMISVWEFRMASNPFRPLFAAYFPGQDSGWFIQTRWGIGRVGGPYGHAILMGAILSVGLMFAVWLWRSNLWERNLRIIGNVYFSKAQILTAGIAAAMGMTLSRGPVLGGLLGLVIASAAFQSRPARALLQRLALVVILLTGVYFASKAYTESEPGPEEILTKGRSMADSSEVKQSTVYRAALFDRYLEIVLQRPWFGWGRANWPVVPGMSSIDNNYLFLALNNGIGGLALFCSMLLTAAFQLVRSGLSVASDAIERAFHFTLMGALVAVAITTASVFMGSQLYPLTFLLIGWADDCYIRQMDAKPEEDPEESLAANYEPAGVSA